VPFTTRLRRGLRSLLLRGLIRALALLPRSLGMALGTAAGRAGWVLAGKTRRLILGHLALALPELSPVEREAIGRACLVHLAWLAAEVVTLDRGQGCIEAYVSFAPGAEALLRELMAPGRGLVMVSGHIGHWELLAQRLALTGIPCATIAKAGHDAKLTDLLGRFRAAGSIEVLLRDAPGTARTMIRCLKQGKLLGLLIDQDTRVQGVFVPFFGQEAWTPRAAGDLALRFQAPVAVIWSRRRGPRPGDGHELRIERVPYDADAVDREAESVRITAACTAVLERAIRERPAEWVWMHRRWKSRPQAPPRTAAP
jgi:KDO2-lipid IV(A) lauroyltransferase